MQSSKSSLLTDYSKSKADIQHNHPSASLLQAELEQLPLADLQEEEASRRRRSSSDALLRGRHEDDVDGEECLDFELEIPSTHDPHHPQHQQLQLQHQRHQGNHSNNRFDESLLSLGDPFDGFDHDHDDDDEEEEEDVSHSDRHLQASLNASANSFSLKSSTSKRRLHRRRPRPKPGEELQGSMTSTGSSDRSLKIRSRGSSARNVTMAASSQDSANRQGKSLADFLDKRKKTCLLPGSTTEDLCSDMNQAVARAKMGASSSRMSVMSNKQSLPSRSSTAPALMRRNTVDGGMSASSPGGSRLRDYSASAGGTRLRDYSQPGSSTRRAGTTSSAESGTRRMPRRCRSDENAVAAAPSARRIPRRCQSSDDADTLQKPTTKEEEEGKDKDHLVLPTTTGRRMPPKSKSADGSKRQPRRTQSSERSFVTGATSGHSSFVTGSRIRRIQPGVSGSLTRENSVSRSRTNSVSGGFSVSRSISPVRRTLHG